MDELVKLYVYDMSQSSHASSNRSIPTMEIPLVYHTSIVVFGKEYSFNSTDGITITPLVLLRSVNTPDNIHELGRTCKTLDELRRFINEDLRNTFQPRNYDVLLRNCQEFCKRLCEFLGVEGLPSYITTVPQFARNSFGSQDGLIIGAVVIGFVLLIATIVFS